MTSREFAEWMAYASVEPFGPQQEEYRAGVLAACMVNPHRKRSKPIEPHEFFPSLAPPEVKRQPSERIEMLCRLLAKSGAGTYTPAVGSN